jgi:hypothetical protein
MGIAITFDETGQYLTSVGLVESVFFMNIELNSQYVREFLSMVRGAPRTLKMGKFTVQHQFEYSIVPFEDVNSYCVVMQVRRSFVGIAIVSYDGDGIDYDTRWRTTRIGFLK